MAVPITKKSLIGEYHELDTTQSKVVEKLLKKIKNYLEDQTDDDLVFISQYLDVILAENDCLGFDKCCELATPIFDKLLSSDDDWTFKELHTLSMLFGYRKEYAKSYELFQEATDILADEEYADDPDYKATYNAMNYNITLRMLRARYCEPDVNQAELEAAFERSYNHVMKICKAKDSPLQYVLLVRRGIFENDITKVEEGLFKLLDEGGKKLHKTTKDEIVEFLGYMSDEMSKPLADFLQGQRIRARRIELGMTPVDLAAALDTDQNTVNAIERGGMSVSIERLRKLIKILDTTSEYIIGVDDKLRDSDLFTVKFKACMENSTEEDRELVISVVDAIMSTKYPGRGKRNL